MKRRKKLRERGLYRVQINFFIEEKRLFFENSAVKFQLSLRLFIAGYLEETVEGFIGKKS